jgi:hypothetical protein
VVDNQINQGQGIDGATQTYRGFSEPQASTTMYCPGLYDQYFGWISSLTIQNVGDVDAYVEVSYSDGRPSDYQTIESKAAWLLVYYEGAHDITFAVTTRPLDEDEYSSPITPQPLAVIAAANNGTQSQV